MTAINVTDVATFCVYKQVDIHTLGRQVSPAHTEFTRLVAEHGVLGLAALGLLVLHGWRVVWRVKSPRWRAFVAAMVAFSLLYMVVNAMRLVLPAFSFSLAFASPKHE